MNRLVSVGCHWISVAILLISTRVYGEVLRSKKEATLGKEIFSDTFLSNPPGISCSNCHAPETGYTLMNSGLVALVPSGRVGAFPEFSRNSQTVAYTSALLDRLGPPSGEGLIRFFWDGRANSLEEQAQGPLFSGHEMNAGTVYDFCRRIVRRPYLQSIKELLKKRQIDCHDDAEDVKKVAVLALAEFQKSEVVNRFSSKFDDFMKGNAALSSSEEAGFNIFTSTGRCAECHRMKPDNAPLFSDFREHNIGLPANGELASLWVKRFGVMPASDLGVAAASKDEKDFGRFKTPTLRNVTKKPFDGFERRFGHNGLFMSVKDMIRFHSSRQMPNGKVPSPEVAKNLSPIIGNIPLSDQDIDLLISFLKTLEDR